MTSEKQAFFDSIREALAPADREPRPDTGNPAPAGEASVSVVLRARESLEVLLVRRSESKLDPWSGHMALPGGRRDPVDTSGLDTAIRETHEECGLQLAPEWGLGQLAPVSPQTIKVPTIRVTPFVFGVDANATAHVASHEIDAVFWIKLEALQNPDNHHTLQVPLIGSVREFPAYMVDRQTVWGMTYRVLSRFMRHYEGITE